MSMDQIVFERGNYWVRRTVKETFEVYRVEGAHSVRCAIIGYTGSEGIDRARREIDRRIAADEVTA